MYLFAGLIIGLLVGYNLSGITFEDISNTQSFAHELSGRGGQLMSAFGAPSASDLMSKLAMYLLGCGALGMFIGGATESVMQKVKDAKKKCPNCAESIKKDAKVCRYCNHNL